MTDINWRKFKWFRWIMDLSHNGEDLCYSENFINQIDIPEKYKKLTKEQAEKIIDGVEKNFNHRFWRSACWSGKLNPYLYDVKVSGYRIQVQDGRHLDNPSIAVSVFTYI